MTRRHGRRFGLPPLEKEIQADMISALGRMGFDVYNLSQARASMQTPGLLDLYVRHDGWSIAGWIEVKRPGEKATPEQQYFMDREAEHGRWAVLVTSLAELLNELRRAGAPIR